MIKIAKKNKKNITKNKILFYIPVICIICMMLIFYGYHFIAQPVNDTFIFFGQTVSSNFIVDLTIGCFILVSLTALIIYIERKKR